MPFIESLFYLDQVFLVVVEDVILAVSVVEAKLVAGVSVNPFISTLTLKVNQRLTPFILLQLSVCLSVFFLFVRLYLVSFCSYISCPSLLFVPVF